MSKMTKPLLAKLAKLENERDFATNVVYAAAAPLNTIPFNDCYAMATEPVQQSYQYAIAALETFRQEMINQGRAYRCASFGHFTPTWR
jgi:hypothetical protein